MSPPLSPRTPAALGLPTSHLSPASPARGHSQFSRPPRLPEHRETPGSPGLSGPGAARCSGSPTRRPPPLGSLREAARTPVSRHCPQGRRGVTQGTSRPAPANLPSQRELCPQEPGRSPAAPDPTATGPAALASGPRPPPPELKARVSGRTPPPHLRPASSALTCSWPCTTPAPQTLPPPPVATKRHHLPHDNRPASYHTSNLSIGWRGGGFLLRLVDPSCPSSCLYRPFSWTESSPPPGPEPA